MKTSKIPTAFRTTVSINSSRLLDELSFSGSTIPDSESSGFIPDNSRISGWKSTFVSRYFKLFVVLIVSILYFINSSAQITTLVPWSNVYHGTSTSAQTSTITIPAGSGSNRMLVVAIAASRTSAGARTVTLSYGGQTLTPAAGDMATTTIQQHTQLYYLNEAGIKAATSTSLSVTVGPSNTRVTDVFATVFDGVDQVAPITNSQAYNSGTTAVSTFAFATGLTVNANDQAVEIVSSMRTGSTTPRVITYATNWTMAEPSNAHKLSTKLTA